MRVHNAQVVTAPRIKATGKIKVNPRCYNPCSHSDMIVEGDITVCLSDDAEEK